LQAEHDIPEIKGDMNRLRQALVNLVDNAIKYNQEGGSVEITLSCSQVRVHLSIRDTGIGIAPEELGLVFDKFYRTQRDEIKTTGTGLGLTMAKEIIQAHGGDIWVESEVGVGSNFTFSLPFEK
jgi:signal transduction histidine kinase